MKPSKLHLPWLPSPSTQTLTRIQSQHQKPSNSAVLRTINDPKSTLKQVLIAFSSASRQPNFRHDYQTYQALISLLSHRRQFRLAEVVLSLMRRRDGLIPGPTVLVPLISAHCTAGRHVRAVDLFLSFPSSNKAFSFLFNTLLEDRQLDVAESLFIKAADLGFQIQCRYYNALIKGFCDNLRIDDGIRFFKMMLHSGVLLDVITFSTLMSSLGKKGRVLDSNALFGKMLTMGVSPDVACFKILLRVYWMNQMLGDAIGVVKVMKCDELFSGGEVLGLDGEAGEWRGDFGDCSEERSHGVLCGLMCLKK